MKTHEKLVDDTLHALDGIRRAEADPMLYEGITQRLNQPEVRVTRLSNSLFLKVAAGFTLLIGLNIAGMIHYHNTCDLSPTPSAAVATDYLSYLNPVNL